MAKTLFDLTYELARLLGTTYESTATGGSTTTIVDTVERIEADDYWNGGTAWITYDAGGASAAPEGEYSAIGDFVQSTGTITLRSTLSAAVGAGDGYAVATTRYPLQLLIQKVNETVSMLGPIEKTDISTITTAANQTEYTLPTDVYELREVYIQGNLSGASDDYQWVRIYDWDIQKTTSGSANTLILKQYPSGYLIKLVYLAFHPALRVASGVLDESIHPERVVYNAAVACLLWRKAKVGDSDQSVNDLLNYYQRMADNVNSRFPIRQVPRRAKTINVGMKTKEDTFTSPGTP